MLWKIFSPKSLCLWLELRLVKSKEWSCEGAGVGAARVLSPAPGLSASREEGSPWRESKPCGSAACAAQDGEGSSLGHLSGKEKTLPEKNKVA